MDTEQIWKRVSVVMFLTALVVWAFWQIFDPPNASTVLLRDAEGAPVFYQFPFLKLGFSRLWPDLIGWPLLTGIMSATILWEKKLLNKTSLPLSLIRELQYPRLNWVLFFLILSTGASYGLAPALVFGVVFGASVVVDTKKNYPGDKLFNVTAWTIGSTLTAVSVATTVNGLAGVIFLLSLFLGGTLLAGLLFGAWYSIKFLASLRPKVEERSPTIDSGQ